MKIFGRIALFTVLFIALSISSVSSSYFLNISGNKSIIIKNDKTEYILIARKDNLSIFSKAGEEVAKYDVQGKSNQIIDLCVSDIDMDGNDKILLLIGKSNQVYAEDFIIIALNKITSGKANRAFLKITMIYEKNVKTLNPWKVQTADVEGDGKIDISLGVYKKAEFHPVLAKRPFIYNWDNNKLTPKWLGSRLSRPFDDYIFADIDNDKLDELISIEYLENSKKVLAAYKWKGFGFESIGQSQGFDDITDIQVGKFNKDIGYSIVAMLKKNNENSHSTRFIYGNNSINIE